MISFVVVAVLGRVHNDGRPAMGLVPIGMLHGPPPHAARFWQDLFCPELTVVAQLAANVFHRPKLPTFGAGALCRVPETVAVPTRDSSICAQTRRVHRGHSIRSLSPMIPHLAQTSGTMTVRPVTSSKSKEQEFSRITRSQGKRIVRRVVG